MNFFARALAVLAVCEAGFGRWPADADELADLFDALAHLVDVVGLAFARLGMLVHLVDDPEPRGLVGERAARSAAGEIDDHVRQGRR